MSRGAAESFGRLLPVPVELHPQYVKIWFPTETMAQQRLLHPVAAKASQSGLELLARNRAVALG